MFYSKIGQPSHPPCFFAIGGSNLGHQQGIAQHQQQGAEKCGGGEQPVSPGSPQVMLGFIGKMMMQPWDHGIMGSLAGIEYPEVALFFRQTQAARHGSTSSSNAHQRVGAPNCSTATIPAKDQGGARCSRCSDMPQQ